MTIDEQLTQALDNQEIQLSDGQTSDIPAPELLPEIPDSNSQTSQNAAFLPTSSTTTNSGNYNRDEFAAQFADFLAFLKNPQSSADTFEALRAEGQELAAGKIYDMACRYKWLNWLIDRRTRLFHDMALIGIFAATETNAIVYNWTGLSLAEKGKIWLKSKIKARAAQAQSQGKRSVWAFLGLRGAEKQPKQENLSAD